MTAPSAALPASATVAPATGAPAWLKAVMAVNPLTYAVAALRRAYYLGRPLEGDVPSLGLALGVTAAFCAAGFAASAALTRRHETAGGT